MIIKNKQLPDSFETPEAAIKFLLEQNVIKGFGGFDVDKLDDEEKDRICQFFIGAFKVVRALKYKK